MHTYFPCHDAMCILSSYYFYSVMDFDIPWSMPNSSLKTGCRKTFRTRKTASMGRYSAGHRDDYPSPRITLQFEHLGLNKLSLGSPVMNFHFPSSREKGHDFVEYS